MSDEDSKSPMVPENCCLPEAHIDAADRLRDEKDSAAPHFLLVAHKAARTQQRAGTHRSCASAGRILSSRIQSPFEYSSGTRYALTLATQARCSMKKRPRC
jgi:hypothetical protein